MLRFFQYLTMWISDLIQKGIHSNPRVKRVSSFWCSCTRVQCHLIISETISIHVYLYYLSIIYLSISLSIYVCLICLSQVSWLSSLPIWGKYSRLWKGKCHKNKLKTASLPLCHCSLDIALHIAIVYNSYKAQLIHISSSWIMDGFDMLSKISSPYSWSSKFFPKGVL